MKTINPLERTSLAMTLLLATCFTLSGHADEKHADEKHVGEKHADENKAAGEPSAELSIAPLDHVDYPSDRPKWVQRNENDLSLPTDASQTDQVISIVVVSPPQPTPEAAAEMMEVMAKGAVENYIDQQAATIPESIDTSKIVVEMDWIRNELITRRYDGEVRSGDQTEYESACWMQLTTEHQTTLQNLIQNHRLMHRLGAVGVFALGGFASLVGGSILFSGLAARQQRRAS
ncbi:hypothetical protein [Neorhodopirellula pilleata]|uniref:Transmembrane protein n=1 Tax=Neorhodopirellula pilleata TaxID=2714738 RepID=A0A5C5ZWV1_9BACT|nr:hypothetical protein [Neorhodopirellula pilleata]TWT91606.1 hypothetical protein Pla100_49970 [Neorhodopirellula pilleata]